MPVARIVAAPDLRGRGTLTSGQAPRSGAKQSELGAQLAEVGAFLDAALGPLLGERDDPLGELVRHGARIRSGYLDHDLAHNGLSAAAELVPVLRRDREGFDLVSQQQSKLLDLGLRRIPSCEDAEVHANLDRRHDAITHAEHEGLRHQFSRGSHRNLNAATARPVAPQAPRTASAAPFVQIARSCRYTEFTMSTKYLSGSTSPSARRKRG